MFDIAKEAGLGPSDLSKLLKVARVTASLWLNGHANPHHLLRTKVTRLLDGVGRAVEAGELPAPVDLRRGERTAYIERTIVKHLTPPAAQ